MKEAKGTATNAKTNAKAGTKTTATPDLRFPEFRGKEEWNHEPLGNLYTFKPTNSFSREKLNYENGMIKNIHYGDIHTKFSTLFDVKNEVVPFVNDSEAIEKIKLENYCTEGDMIFADASEDLEDIGKSIEIVRLHNQKLLSGLHTILARQKNKKIAIGFGGYLFKSNRIRTAIKKEAQGSKILGISANRLSNIEIYYPPSKGEQQKIADCLTSLDELISAQGEKLTALKKHKKGLLQKLFPAEGETTPGLRFPEFRDKGAWEVKRLREVCEKSFSGGTPTTSNKDYYNGQIPFIRSAEIGKEETELFLSEKGLMHSAAKLIKKGNILFALYGANSGNVAIAKLDGAINQAIVCLQAKGINQFIYQYLLNIKDYIVSNYIQGGQGNLSSEIVKSIKIPLPSLPEQQKIADCLTSLDEVINAEDEKLTALKEHKKGLMQKLFPEQQR